LVRRLGLLAEDRFPRRASPRRPPFTIELFEDTRRPHDAKAALEERSRGSSTPDWLHFASAVTDSPPIRSEAGPLQGSSTLYTRRQHEFVWFAEDPHIRVCGCGRTDSPGYHALHARRNGMKTVEVASVTVSMAVSRSQRMRVGERLARPGIPGCHPIDSIPDPRLNFTVPRSGALHRCPPQLVAGVQHPAPQRTRRGPLETRSSTRPRVGDRTLG